jgi:hypothetical protein
MTLRRPVAIAAALVACAASAGGAATRDVFKCQGDRGIPVYQETPCEPGRTLRNFADEPASVSIIPFAPASPPLASEAPSPAARTTPSRRAPGRQALSADSTPPRRARVAPPSGDASERRHLREGMTESEVRTRIGPPDFKGGGAKGGAQWNYLPAPADPSTLTTVRFEKGRVVAVDRTVVR